MREISLPIYSTKENSGGKTSAPIGTWDVILEIMTEQRTDRPTDRPTDMRVHRKVYLPIKTMLNACICNYSKGRDG